jgi:hypothetical protein
MYGGYDFPPWAYGEDAEDYTFCESSLECFVLRMLKTYCSLVRQRYSASLPSKRTTLVPGATDFRKTPYYEAFCEIAGKLQEAGVEDPEDFIVYLFERWLVEGKHDKYLGVSFSRRGEKVEASSSSGYGYPSLRFIQEEGEEFLADFLSVLSRGYRPKYFITQGNLEELSSGKILDEKVAQWAALMESTEEEYWRRGMHWHYPYLTYNAAKGSKSLQRCIHVIRDVLVEQGCSALQDVSLEEVYEGFLTTISLAEKASAEETRKSVARYEAARRAGQPPEYQNLRVLDPDYELLSEVDRERVLAYRDAVLRGVDVTAPRVQREIEDRVNPVDTEHPDTILHALYGVGCPRRVDGSRVDVIES